MCCNDLICPYKHIILGAVVKAEDHIVYLADFEGVVNVVYSSLLVISAHVGKVALVSTEILIEHLDTVVTVTANERVRKDAIHHSNSFLSSSPLIVRACLGVVLMSYVHTELGDVAKTDNVLDILSILIADDPLVDLLELFGILIGYGLSIAYNSKAVCIGIICKLNIFLFPKQLLVICIISVAGQVLKIGICVLGIDPVSEKELGAVKRTGIVCGNLAIASHIGVEAELLDKALEILIISVFPILAVALCVTQGGISTYKELLVEGTAAVSNHVFDHGLLKLTVNVATCLTCRHIVNYREMLPCSGSEIYVGKSMIGGCAVSIGIGKTGITCEVYLEHNTRTVVAAVVTDYGTTDSLCIKCPGHIYPRLKGLNAAKRLIYLIFTEVLNLYTATVYINELVSTFGVVTQSSLAHSCNIVSSHKTVTALPILHSLHIGLYLCRSTYIAVHSNGVNKSLEVIGIALTVITAYSEGVGIIGCLRECKACRISGSLVNTVNIKADTAPTAVDNDSIVMYAVKSYVCALAGIEVGDPLAAGIEFSAYSKQAPLYNLYVNVGGCTLAIVTNYNTAGIGTGDRAASGELKLDSHRRYLFGHIIIRIFLKVT